MVVTWNMALGFCGEVEMVWTKWQLWWLREQKRWGRRVSVALVTNGRLVVVHICGGPWTDGAWDMISGFDDADVDVCLERVTIFGECFLSPSPDGDYRRHGDRVDCFPVGAGTEQLWETVGGHAGIPRLSVVLGWNDTTTEYESDRWFGDAGWQWALAPGARWTVAWSTAMRPEVVVAIRLVKFRPIARRQRDCSDCVCAEDACGRKLYESEAGCGVLGRGEGYDGCYSCDSNVAFWTRVLTSSKKVLLEQWPDGEHERRKSRGTPELPDGSVDRVASALCFNRAACQVGRKSRVCV